MAYGVKKERDKRQETECHRNARLGRDLGGYRWLCPLLLTVTLPPPSQALLEHRNERLSTLLLAEEALHVVYNRDTLLLLSFSCVLMTNVGVGHVGTEITMVEDHLMSW